MAEGVEDAGKSEGSAVMAEIGPREREYPARKGGRLPAGLSGAMRLDASTDGDVRQRKLNRPKDGCRKPPVRRNQDRVLRAAEDLFPRRGGLSRVRGNCAP